MALSLETPCFFILCNPDVIETFICPLIREFNVLGLYCNILSSSRQQGSRMWGSEEKAGLDIILQFRALGFRDHQGSVRVRRRRETKVKPWAHHPVEGS